MPLQAGRRAGRRPPARDHDGEARRPVRAGPRRRERRRRGRLRGDAQLHHPAAKASFDDRPRRDPVGRPRQRRGPRRSPQGDPEGAARRRDGRRRPRPERPGAGRRGRWRSRARGRGRDRRPGQHRRRGRRFRLLGGLPVADRRRPGHLSSRRGVGPRRARRRSARLAPPAAVRAAAAARGHDAPRLPRVARQPDPGLRPGARPVGHPRARLADRRPGDLLRPHPPARGPRPRLEADRQRRVRGLRLRRRPDRLVGARRRSTATT